MKPFNTVIQESLEDYTLIVKYRLPQEKGKVFPHGGETKFHGKKAAYGYVKLMGGWTSDLERYGFTEFTTVTHIGHPPHNMAYTDMFYRIEDPIVLDKLKEK